MRIKMMTTARGADFNANEGDEIDVTAKRAADLIGGGYAVPLSAPEPETATEPEPAEQATAPKKKRSRKGK